MAKGNLVCLSASLSPQRAKEKQRRRVSEVSTSGGRDNGRHIENISQQNLAAPRGHRDWTGMRVSVRLSVLREGEGSRQENSLRAQGNDECQYLLLVSLFSIQQANGTAACVIHCECDGDWGEYETLTKLETDCSISFQVNGIPSKTY